MQEPLPSTGQYALQLVTLPIGRPPRLLQRGDRIVDPTRRGSPRTAPRPASAQDHAIGRRIRPCFSRHSSQCRNLYGFLRFPRPRILRRINSTRLHTHNSQHSTRTLHQEHSSNRAQRDRPPGSRYCRPASSAVAAAAAGTASEAGPVADSTGPAGLRRSGSRQLASVVSRYGQMEELPTGWGV